MTMPGLVVRNVVNFLREFLARDRYLTEALAALTTFATGVLILRGLGSIDNSVNLVGFRDMPAPELWVALFSVPGLARCWRLWRGARDEETRREGRVGMLVMYSFFLLCTVSHVLGFENWLFWACFALWLGIAKGYALVSEQIDLRWGVTCLGAMFWIMLTLSILQNAPGDLPPLLGPAAGWAVANLLSVSRLAGRRGNV